MALNQKQREEMAAIMGVQAIQRIFEEDWKDPERLQAKGAIGFILNILPFIVTPAQKKTLKPLFDKATELEQLYKK